MSELSRDPADTKAEGIQRGSTEAVIEAGSVAGPSLSLDQASFELASAQMVEFERLMNEPVGNNKELAKLLSTLAPWER